jgi:hypothetical protein
MGCTRGCPRRCREAAIRAGWYLHTAGERAGWWDHDELAPYTERRFRDEDVDKNPTMIVAQHKSIRKEAIGFAKKVASREIRAFINRLQGT